MQQNCVQIPSDGNHDHHCFFYCTDHCFFQCTLCIKVNLESMAEPFIMSLHAVIHVCMLAGGAHVYRSHSCLDRCQVLAGTMQQRLLQAPSAAASWTAWLL